MYVLCFEGVGWLRGGSNNNERPKLWKPRALCSKDVAKHTIYGVYFVIICAQENVGL